MLAWCLDFMKFTVEIDSHPSCSKHTCFLIIKHQFCLNEFKNSSFSSPVTPAIFRGLDGYMWLEAAILDSIHLLGQVRYIDTKGPHS